MCKATCGVTAAETTVSCLTTRGETSRDRQQEVSLHYLLTAHPVGSDRCGDTREKTFPLKTTTVTADVLPVSFAEAEGFYMLMEERNMPPSRQTATKEGKMSDSSEELRADGQCVDKAAVTVVSTVGCLFT